jgi:ribosome-binding factor A
MDEIRRKRIEEQLRDLIAELILGGEVKDPRVGAFVSVTRVEAARDISAARVFVSTFTAGGEGSEETRHLDTAVAGLQSAGLLPGFTSSRIRGSRKASRSTRGSRAFSREFGARASPDGPGTPLRDGLDRETRGNHFVRGARTGQARAPNGQSGARRHLG